MYGISNKLLLILQVLNLKQKVILNLRMVQVIRHFLENRMKGHEKVTKSLYCGVRLSPLVLWPLLSSYMEENSV
jgi:hypothetical protein